MSWKAIPDPINYELGMSVTVTPGYCTFRGRPRGRHPDRVRQSHPYGEQCQHRRGRVRRVHRLWREKSLWCVWYRETAKLWTTVQEQYGEYWFLTDTGSSMVLYWSLLVLHLIHLTVPFYRCARTRSPSSPDTSYRSESWAQPINRQPTMPMVSQCSDRSALIISSDSMS